MSLDLPDKERMCHRTGFEKSCRDLVTSGACQRWMLIQGTNPQTNEPVNRHNCIDDWTPLLLIENSQMQRQTGAAIESFRNEVAAANGFPNGHPHALPQGGRRESGAPALPGNGQRRLPRD